jgi:hypothetical protein
MLQGAAAAAEAGYTEQQQQDVAYFLWEGNGCTTDAVSNWLLAGKLLADLVTLERMFDSWSPLRRQMTRNALLAHFQWYRGRVPTDPHAPRVAEWIEAWPTPDDREALRVGARYAMNFEPVRAAFSDNVDILARWTRM